MSATSYVSTSTGSHQSVSTSSSSVTVSGSGPFNTRKSVAVQRLLSGIHCDRVWERIRDFSNFAWATDKDTKTGPENPSLSLADNAGRVGVRRVINMAPSGFVVQQLTAHSDAARTYSYTILSFSPEAFPGRFANYHATLWCKPATDGCIVEWTATFDGEAETADFIVLGLENDVFGPGLARLEYLMKHEMSQATLKAEEQPRALEADPQLHQQTAKPAELPTAKPGTAAAGLKSGDQQAMNY